MIFNLTNKTILITGASSGIGRACAILCSQMGARVIGLGRNMDRLQETAAMILEDHGHVFLNADITDFESLEQLVKDVLAASGPLHGMINSAGISSTLPLRMIKPDKMEELFKVNVSAAINLARLVCKPVYVSPDGASLVFLTSVMATVGESGKSMYAMTKGAILSATKSLAIELASKSIRVNCVSPGVVDTPMSAASHYSRTPEALDHIRSLHPLGLGKPDDVAAACVYLLSDAARWVTDTNLMVDGGYTAR